MSGAGDGGSARDLVVDIHKQGLGYITSHSCSVYSPEHKAILTTFDLWNGEETVTVLTTSSGSYTAGLS
mgnify:CR=1 FL=1